jgi:hypothetical protein
MQVRTSLSARPARIVSWSTRHAAALLAVSALTTGLGLGVAGTAVALAPAALSPSMPTHATQAQRYADAVQAFQAQRYSVAYGTFATLADEGHAPSALMALALVRYSPVFGTEWSVTPAQLRDWSALALQDVRMAGPLIARLDSE